MRWQGSPSYRLRRPSVLNKCQLLPDPNPLPAAGRRIPLCSPQVPLLGRGMPAGLNRVNTAASRDARNSALSPSGTGLSTVGFFSSPAYLLLSICSVPTSDLITGRRKVRSLMEHSDSPRSFRSACEGCRKRKVRVSLPRTHNPWGPQRSFAPSRASRAKLKY